MVEPINVGYCDVITIKGREDTPKRKTPFVLQGSTSTSTSKACTNAVSHSWVKFILKGFKPSTSTTKQPNDTTIVGSTNKNPKLVPSTNTTNYNILDKLQRTTAQITIFELLKILHAHIEILDRALSKVNVPKDLNID